MFIISLIVVVVVTIILFIRLSPVFGKRPSKDRRREFEKLDHFSEGTFVNQIPTSMAANFREMLPVLKEFMKGNPNRRPKQPISIEPLNLSTKNNEQQTKITWFGHSAFLLQANGKNILIDPMFGRAPSPVPIFGNKRYSKKLPFSIEELPQIDLIILSHDHYDHLDYGSIKKLKNKVSQFIVPLGVAGHLKRWGVPNMKIKECDWWDEAEFAGLSLVCTPSRHFSGRSLTDRNSTLWSSWVIKGKDFNLYFSADSGYGPHFKEIGEKYGPFDVTLMECGQYHENWSAIHMLPEETVQAHLDVKGKLMIPIHWGAFTLSLHDWTEPVERALKAANEHSVAVSTPKIGETILLNKCEYPKSPWWR